MPRPPATSCWDSPTMLVALPRNPARYVRLAQALIDAVPCTWSRTSAHLVIGADGDSRCDIAATCGDDARAGPECMAAARAAIVELAHAALVPDGSAWVGIWIDYDIDGDRLKATIIHGGPQGSKRRDGILALDLPYEDVIQDMPPRRVA